MLPRLGIEQHLIGYGTALDCTYVIEPMHAVHIRQLREAAAQVPSWSSVGDAMASLKSEGPFTWASLRRLVLRQLSIRRAKEEGRPPPTPVPLTTDLDELIQQYLDDLETSIFASVFSKALEGAPIASHLRPAAWWRYHRTICRPCQAFPEEFEKYRPLNICNGCPISVVLAWIHHGYLPTLQREPGAGASSNSSSVARAPRAVFQDIKRRVAMGWAKPFSNVLTYSPLTVAVKDHEVARACKALREHLPSLAQASDRELSSSWDDLKDLLLSLPTPLAQKYKFKIRVCFNASNTINPVMPVRHFRYPDFIEAIAHVKEGHHLYKIDLADMYMQLPLHPRAYPYFIFVSFQCQMSRRA